MEKFPCLYERILASGSIHPRYQAHVGKTAQSFSVNNSKDYFLPREIPKLYVLNFFLNIFVALFNILACFSLLH